jgi:hypothetical protein
MDLPDDLDLESPSELWPFVTALQEAVNVGRLVQFHGFDESADDVDIRDLKRGQPWPGDFMHWRFENPDSGITYQFTLETYHGTGGKWRRLLPEAPQIWQYLKATSEVLRQYETARISLEEFLSHASTFVGHLAALIGDDLIDPIRTPMNGIDATYAWVVTEQLDIEKFRDSIDNDFAEFRTALQQLTRKFAEQP